MPWMEQTTMSLKEKFIQSVLTQTASMTMLCEDFGISRKTGYKWLSRYMAGGIRALEDQRGSRPLRDKGYSQQIWEYIYALRERFPSYGPRKLVNILSQDHPELEWPSFSLVKLRLREQGYVRPRIRSRKLISERLALRDMMAPNDIWCIDFKGWFMTQDGHRCEPLTLMDGYSRYLLACVPLRPTNFSTVKPELEKAFYEYGKPDAIRSDNGAPFGSSGFRGLSPLSVWLLKQGIFPEKIRPGKPGENGRLERLHRTLKGDTPNGKTCNYSDYTEHLAAFVHQYNERRPHESLGDLPPSSFYIKSRREYTGKEEEYEYPAGYSKVRVSKSGYFQYKRQQVYLTESLGGEYIGIGEGEGGHVLSFRGYPLGTPEQHMTRKKGNQKVLPL